MAFDYSKYPTNIHQDRYNQHEKPYETTPKKPFETAPTRRELRESTLETTMLCKDAMKRLEEVYNRKK